MSDLNKVAIEANAWPFKEAQQILQKINYKTPAKGYVLFETGYGPSGIPHIGTFCEVARTTMVRKAFEMLAPEIPTRFICFSDDMDGMRKIPDNLPNAAEYVRYLDLPLTKVPDPFGTAESFGHNMNQRLCDFLDHYSFEYEFLSATACYQQGMFNEALKQVLHHYDEIMAIMLPTLGEERQATYSPFLPLCPKTGRVLQVPIIERDLENYTITYLDDNQQKVTVPVTDGHCKLQWKPDFGMRWQAFDVDFEMYGKDHLVNGPIYTKICQAIGGKGPHQMFYELFLDAEGKKISKSKGNGITIDEWLRYAPRESLLLFIYQSPQKAKKLYFDVIPKNVDEYIAFLNAYHRTEELKKKLENPVYHLHFGAVPDIKLNLSYSLILNLVSACNSEDENVLWGYIKRVEHDLSPANEAFLKELVGCAINYYHDFIKPHKQFRAANAQERDALLKLITQLRSLKTVSAEEIQNVVYAIGKEQGFELKDWFQALYEILLGASQGPRFGSFIALYGIEETILLIEEKIA